MIKYHISSDSIKIAEILPGFTKISTVEEILEIMADAGYNGCDKIIVHAGSLKQDFFKLKTGLAGEILQKFSNYRMRLAIIGDFSGYKSKSLHDFIRESNNRRIITFVSTLNEALDDIKT